MLCSLQLDTAPNTRNCNNYQMAATAKLQEQCSHKQLEITIMRPVLTCNHHQFIYNSDNHLYIPLLTPGVSSRNVRLDDTSSARVYGNGARAAAARARPGCACIFDCVFINKHMSKHTRVLNIVAPIYRRGSGQARAASTTITS